MLLLETMLAFEDKDALVRDIASALRPGGRLAVTLEEGPPLTTAERAAMPDADTVWLTPLDEMATSLGRAGLVVTWQEDHSRAHRAMAQALGDAFAADAEDIAAQIGRRALDELLAADRLWIEWLDEGGSEARTGGGARLASPDAEGPGWGATATPRPHDTPPQSKQQHAGQWRDDRPPKAHRCDRRTAPFHAMRQRERTLKGL